MAKKGTDARLLLVNGAGIKSVNPWDLESSPEAWTSLSGDGTKGEKEIQAFFSQVPWLRRGVNIVASSVANLPFTISNFTPTYDKEDKKKIIGGKIGEEADNSEEYENKLGFLPHPKSLFWLFCASRQLTGRAYAFRGRNNSNFTKSLKYLIPTSVKPKFSEEEKTAGQLVSFIRTISTGKGMTKDIEKKIEDIVYSWMADPYVETGPPKNWPALNALLASGVMLSLDEALASFFKGGMVKQTVFTVPPNTQKEERERIENILARTISGVRSALTGPKVFNADAFNPVVIGEGAENLNDGGLSKQKREDIAAAFGIPMSKLFSTEAGGLGGGGVVEQDDLNFLNETVIPETEAIYEDLNEQVFHPSKYHIELNTDNIDAFQEDEKERSAAVTNITSAVSLNPLAFEFASSVMGYDLNDEQKKMLEAIKADKVAQREVFQARVSDERLPDKPLSPVRDPEDQGKAIKELGRWKRHALRVGGERSAAEWEPSSLSQEVVAFLSSSLPACKTDSNIKGLFEAMKHMLESGSFTGTVIAATKAALAKAKTAKKIDAIFSDLTAERKDEHG